MPGPNPDTRHPFRGETHMVFLKTVITRPTIEVGDFTYYHDPENAADFENRNVLYHFDFVGDRLIIGRFCALATGCRFIMNGANHSMTGFSTYPFNIFSDDWSTGFDPATVQAGLRGDTKIGNDVWIGRDATVLPGITVGDGAIIGAGSLVASDVPAYAVVAGNPGRILRYRYSADIVERLLDIAWWNWPVQAITKNLQAIRGSDIDLLEAAGAGCGKSSN